MTSFIAVRPTVYNQRVVIGAAILHSKSCSRGGMGYHKPCVLSDHNWRFISKDSMSSHYTCTGKKLDVLSREPKSQHLGISRKHQLSQGISLRINLVHENRRFVRWWVSNAEGMVKCNATNASPKGEVSAGGRAFRQREQRASPQPWEPRFQ